MVVDSMRESIHAIRCDFLYLQASGPGRGKPVLICILACSLGIFTKITILKINPVIFLPIENVWRPLEKNRSLPVKWHTVFPCHRECVEEYE